MSHAWREELARYAALAAELADAGGERDSALARHGLDEQGWEAIEERWLERLAAAEAEHGDLEGVPPLVVAHAEALARAQAARAPGLLSFEKWIDATTRLARGEDRALVLSRLGIGLDALLRAQRHWTMKMVEDPALAARFEQAMR